MNVLVCSVVGKNGVRAEVRFCSGPSCDAQFLVRIETKEYSINNCAFMKADSLWYAKDRLSLTETLQLAESIADKQEMPPERVEDQIPANWIDSPAVGV